MKKNISNTKTGRKDHSGRSYYAVVAVYLSSTTFSTALKNDPSFTILSNFTSSSCITTSSSTGAESFLILSYAAFVAGERFSISLSPISCLSQMA